MELGQSNVAGALCDHRDAQMGVVHPPAPICIALASLPSFPLPPLL